MRETVFIFQELKPFSAFFKKSENRDRTSRHDIRGHALHSILWGKRWGTFRVVLWLAVLPGLTTVILAYSAPPVTARFVPAGSLPPDSTPLSPVDHVAAPCLVVGQMLTYGAAFTSIGLTLATGVSRLGRAIAISVAIFALITIGWPVFFGFVIWNPLQEWLATQWNIVGTDSRWFVSAMMAISPFGAPIVTLEGLLDYDSSTRCKVWSFDVAWCVLASAIAAAMFWAAVWSFDRCLGRMPERSMWD